MDACAVSMSDGLSEPQMKKRKWVFIAALFAIFQAVMPLCGFFAGHALIDYIGAYIPWIALALLVLLGGKMIFDGVRDIIKERKGLSESDEKSRGLTVKTLFVQAVATSIDALSVGLTIADYTIAMAFVAVALIGAVTFGLCFVSVFIGKKFGDKLGSKAVIVGGVILIAIGIEICLTGVL